jgi:predicted amino acid dehydrogenase
MKRVISACLEQTQKFETESDYENFIKGLETVFNKISKIADKTHIVKSQSKFHSG